MKKTTAPSKIVRNWIHWKSADGLERIEQTEIIRRESVLYRYFVLRLRLSAILTENTPPEGPATTRREYYLYDRIVKTKGRFIDVTHVYKENL